MELKRLLDRENVLLLQGAYQGAESFIEQAMSEADKIKSDLAEIDTLRTRVTEMASEVDRLQPSIDEANAQPAFGHVIKENGSMCEFVTTNNVPVGCHTVYARPIPEQQSPAVAVPDEGELRRIFEEYYADDRFPIQRDAFGDYFENDQRGRTLNNDWDEWKRCRKAMLDIVSNQDSAPSPRITEQDAREIARSFNIFRSQGHGLHPDGIVNKWLRSDECRELLKKLNEANNEKAN